MVATLYHGVVRRVRAGGDQGDSMGSIGACEDGGVCIQVFRDRYMGRGILKRWQN